MAKYRELCHGFNDDDLDDGGDDDGEDARQAAQDSPHHLTRPHTGHLVHGSVEQFTWNCVIVGKCLNKIIRHRESHQAVPVLLGDL